MMIHKFLQGFASSIRVISEEAKRIEGFMRDQEEVKQSMLMHGDAVWRCCCLYFRNQADAEDAYQETFLKFATNDRAVFVDAEHQKAWLLRVCSNVCKDLLKSAHRRDLSFEESGGSVEPLSEDSEVTPGSDYMCAIDAMQSLDDPPKTPLYLALCEGYTAPEISEMMQVPVNTVYSWVSRGKKMLREALA